MSSRGNFFRFQDRASYKTSDVLALFIFGITLGMLFVGMCMLIDYVVQNFIGPVS